MKRLLFLTAFLVVAVTLYTSANWDRVKGRGAVTTETRTLPPITGIRLEGSTQVRITNSSTQEVTVEGYNNLLPLLETRVEGETLVISYKKGTNVTNDNSVVYLKIPSVKKISVSGSGNLEMAGAFNEAKLEIAISGSSNILLEDGTANNFNVQISGSGNVNAYTFKTQKAKVNIFGSGNVKVSATQSLDAAISGSGNVYYKGAPPAVKSSLAGSGRVIPQ